MEDKAKNRNITYQKFIKLNIMKSLFFLNVFIGLYFISFSQPYISYALNGGSTKYINKDGKVVRIDSITKVVRYIHVFEYPCKIVLYPNEPSNIELSCSIDVDSDLGTSYSCIEDFEFNELEKIKNAPIYLISIFHKHNFIIFTESSDEKTGLLKQTTHKMIWSPTKEYKK